MKEEGAREQAAEQAVTAGKCAGRESIPPSTQERGGRISQHVSTAAGENDGWSVREPSAARLA